MIIRHQSTAVILAATLVACSEGSSTPGAVPEDTADLACPDNTVSPSRMRRLTRTEYDNTVRDLLGDRSRPAQAFPPDDATDGFAANAFLPINRLGVEQYMFAAETLAANVEVLPLLPCDGGMDATACARAFVEDFGERAYRRPLSSDEVDTLLSVYERKASGAGFEAGIQLAIATMLQSPNFLYRVEIGSTSGDVSAPLSDYEVASRLSYFLWATMPDETLFALADAGELSDPAVLAEQARRMLEDPKASDAYVSFYSQWLGLSDLGTVHKSDAYYPDFDDRLRDSMFVETMVFIDAVMRHEGGSFATLLTAPFTYVNADLQAHYGLSGAPIGDNEYVRVELPTSERSGILTHASVLTRLSDPDQSSPVLRGKFIRERLLCSPPPPPPPDADITPPEIDPNLPAKDRWAQHREDPACNGCHVLMDPIGMGFEHYDAIGRYRETDGAFPVDAQGEIVATQSLDGTFEGAIELGTLLSQSDEVHRCVSRQWLRFALGRREGEEDQCSLDAIDQAFADSDQDLNELVVAIVTSDAFRYWRAPQ